MNVQEIAAKFFLAHPLVVSFACFVLGVLLLLSRVLVKQWPMPPVTAPRWERALYFIIVNLPDVGRSIDGKTWMGTTFSIPFLSWTLRPPAADPADKARALLNEEPKKRGGDAGVIDVGVLLCIVAATLVYVLVLLGMS